MFDRFSIRAAMKQQRRELSLPMQSKAAYSISDFIQTQSWFHQASHVAFYAAVGAEIDPYLLLEKASAMGKTCYLPALSPPDHEQLQFIPYYPGDPLTINDYGILEPLSDLHLPFELSLLDCVLTPLVACDHLGNRLGSGKGYYDKTFAHLLDASVKHTTKLIGLGYGFQHIPELIPESWDVPLDNVVIFDTVQGKSQLIR